MTQHTGNVFTPILTAGAGSAVGYIASAMITARAARKTDAEQAGSLVSAASMLTDRLLTRNNELAHTNTELRKALSKLAGAVQVAQDTFEHFPELGDGAKNREMMLVLQAGLDAANSVTF